MILIILAEKGAGCHKVLVRTCITRLERGRVGLIHLPVDAGHGFAHFGNHHFHSGRVECVRFISLKRHHWQGVVHFLACLSINPSHNQVLLLRLIV